MNNKVMGILKAKSYVVPSYLISNYKEFDLDSTLVLIMIYLLNLDSPIICDYQKMSKNLNLTLTEIMTYINNLCEKHIIEVKLEKNIDGKIEEHIDLELFYNKVFMHLIDVEEEKKEEDIYSIFERELGRVLSPIEYELINGWLDCDYKKEVIIAALKEAVYNGVNNFRYIDTVLCEWSKKGIDTLEKVENNKKEFQKKKNITTEVPDYDWLSDDEQYI